MSILYDCGDDPRDVMKRVAEVMDFVSEMLCLVPPEDGLELSPQALAGLTYITLECTSALDKAASDC